MVERRGLSLSGPRSAQWCSALGAALTLLLAALVGAGSASALPGPQWSGVYGGASHGDDRFEALVVDDAGNAYGAGVVSRAHGTDALLVKFSASGVRLWARTLDGQGGGDDAAADLARDRWGDLYVTGTTSGNGGDVLIAKYDPHGRLKWRRSYDFKGRSDKGVALATDGSGAVYVAATCVTGASKAQIAVVKYDRNGVRRWARTVCPAATGARARDLAVTSAGAVAVCGRRSSSGLSASLVALLDANGRLHWATGYQGRPRGLADSLRIRWQGSSVWVLGSTRTNGASFSRASIARFTRQGRLLGAYDTPDKPPGYSFRDFTVTSSGAYVAGRFDVPAQPGTDSLVLKVTPNVSYAWAAGLDIGARESFDTIAADSYGNVWVAGQAGGTFTVMGLEPAGYSLGSTTRSGPLLSKDTARAAVCRAGALYVAGWTRIGDADSDALIMRLALR